MLEIDIFVLYKLGSDDVIRFATTMAKRDIQINGNYFSCHIGRGHFPFNQKRKGKSNVTEIFPKKFPKKLKFQKMLSQLSLIISKNLNWNFWLNGKNLRFSNLSVFHNRHAQCLQLPERTSLLEFQTMVLIFLHILQIKNYIL